MRNPFKRRPRPAEKPSLRERAAILKSGLTRLLTRPEGQGEANQRRRALVAGSVAAAIPLPALARTVAPAAPAAVTVEAAPAALPVLVTAPHPDQALLDLGTAYDRAREAEARARQASDAADEIVSAVVERRPTVLVPSPSDWRASGAASPRPGLGTGSLFRFVTYSPVGDGHARLQYAWTGQGLRRAIHQAVPLLGRGGQTPHHIRRWRGLLPAAEAFDAEIAAVEALSDYRRLCAEARDAREVRDALFAEILRTSATTTDGLAVHIRLLAETAWHRQGGTYTTFFQSAAAVVGIELEPAPFDVPAWKAAWTGRGGRIKWLPHRHGRDELVIVCPDLSNLDPGAKSEVRRLEREYAENGTVISRWLEANR